MRVGDLTGDEQLAPPVHAGTEMPCEAIRPGIVLQPAGLAPPISPSVGLPAWSAMSGSGIVQAQACTPTRCRHVAPAGRFEPWAMAVPRPEDRSAGFDEMSGGKIGETDRVCYPDLIGSRRSPP